MSFSEQLTFDFSKNSNFEFDSFFSTEKNREIISVLKSWAGGEGANIIYLWGESSVGKTHLLQSSLKASEKRSIYIPLKEIPNLEPTSFDDLEEVGILALDDVEVLAGREVYEQALFKLFNGVVSKKGRLLVSSKLHPSRQAFALSDLTSRLSSQLVYKVRKLSDKEKVIALAILAERRGMNADQSVWDFVLKRSKRDMSSLVMLLDELDEFSLIQMRRLTVPLVRRFLEEKGKGFLN